MALFVMSEGHCQGVGLHPLHILLVLFCGFLNFGRYRLASSDFQLMEMVAWVVGDLHSERAWEATLVDHLLVLLVLLLLNDTPVLFRNEEQH